MSKLAIVKSGLLLIVAGSLQVALERSAWATCCGCSAPAQIVDSASVAGCAAACLAAGSAAYTGFNYAGPSGYAACGQPCSANDSVCGGVGQLICDDTADDEETTCKKGIAFTCYINPWRDCPEGWSCSGDNWSFGSSTPGTNEKCIPPASQPANAFGGGDTGTLPPDEPTLKCETSVAKAAAKLVTCITKCKINRAKGSLDAAEQDQCESLDPVKSCRAKFNKTRDKLVDKGTCPPCLDGESQDGVAYLTERIADLGNELVYCGSPGGAFLDGISGF